MVFYVVRAKFSLKFSSASPMLIKLLTYGVAIAAEFELSGLLSRARLWTGNDPNGAALY